METNQIIKKPLLTEKTYKLMDKGIYTFIVNKNVNKIEVRNAIEFIFDVEVDRVNIIKVPKKAKKVGKFSGFVPGYKKAMVKLLKGEINFFPDDNKKESEIKEAKIKETKSKEITDVEKRVAEKIARKQSEKTLKNNQKTPTGNIHTNKVTKRGGDK